MLYNAVYKKYLALWCINGAGDELAALAYGIPELTQINTGGMVGQKINFEHSKYLKKNGLATVTVALEMEASTIKELGISEAGSVTAIELLSFGEMGLISRHNPNISRS